MTSMQYGVIRAKRLFFLSYINWYIIQEVADCLLHRWAVLTMWVVAFLNSVEVEI